MKYVFVLFISIVFMSCDSNSDYLENSKWLNGQWKNEYNGVMQVENWIMDENGFTGHHLFINNDTNLMNTFSVQKTDNNWELSKHMADEDLDFYYELISSNSDSAIFQNKNNEWPQRIVYKKLSKSEMEIGISGNDGTMNKDYSFTYVRF